MQSSFTGLYWGLGFSIILIYLLVVVNFQSWTEPFIIITALPCALAGIIWMLIPDRNDSQCSGFDGNDYVHGRRDIE